MGDHGNIFVMQQLHTGDSVGIFLYSHHGGYELPLILRNALVRGKSRWDDEPYLTRIIFCEMISEDDLGSLTGFGISTYITDNEYPILVVNCLEMTIGVSREVKDSHPAKLEREISFEDYVNSPRDELLVFRGSLY